MSGIRVVGVVRAGRGVGAIRMATAAFGTMFQPILGFTPVPGTLNLRVEGSLPVDALDHYLGGDAIDARWADAVGQTGYRWAPVSIAGRYRGVAFQAEEPGYPADLVELIAAVRLREALALEDGDVLSFEIEDRPASLAMIDGAPSPVSTPAGLTGSAGRRGVD